MRPGAVELHIKLDGRNDLSGQIYRGVRAAILDGRLQPGQRIGSTRESAARLAVARNTVGTAYDRLIAEGYLTCRAGVGTYVSRRVEIWPGPQPSPERASPRPPSTAPPIRPRAVWDEQPEPLDAGGLPPYDFRPGLPDATGFPLASWRAVTADSLRAATVGTGAYLDPAGHPDLRSAIARHLGVSRGVVVSSDDVLITNGIQQTIDLVSRVLLDAGDIVAVEDPGWPPPRNLFDVLGARVVGTPVDAEGLVVDALPAHARLVYVSPSHQFPLGVAMSLPRRLALLAWAERADALIIEDDYDSEFRYVGRPLEPLRSLDRSGRVAYAGTFSKTTLPMLRLGFCVPPPSLSSAMRTAKYLTDWHTALPTQVAMARFIERGLLARHIRRQRRVYASRRDRIAAVLAADPAKRLEPIPAVAGLHITARLADRTLDDRELVRRAGRVGLALPALSEFAVDTPGEPGLILGYGAIGIERIDEGLRRLYACIGES